MIDLLILASSASFVCVAPSVHDGDSLRCDSERIRIENIDASELPDSPKCRDRRKAYAWCDFETGYAARDALAEFVTRGEVKVRRTGVDPYGRTLARVTVNGRDAGVYLIGLGLARRWR